MTYIIGEIGQNHNGSVDIAKLLIDVVARPVEDKLFNKILPKMDAVKLTKRDLKYELSDSQMNREYLTPNSFGKTYGEHREFLELNDEEHFEVYKYAKEKDLDFVETLCAPSCLKMLKLFTPDKLKVASRDLTNLPLLEALAETKIPIIISTGMAGEKELDDALGVMEKYHSKISILHCVSQYPTEYDNVNLNSISFLKKKYPEYAIGYSDHTIGIATPIAAVAMGAEIIEKHITLDRKMKGTDQAGSLAIDGIGRMVRDIRNLEMSIGEEKITVEDSVKKARIKLERSIASNKKLNKGHIISESDIHLLSPGDGVKWIDKKLVIGKKLKEDLPENEIIYLNNID
ncbi:N-acetylneuraminate synthase family protein [Tenacibaculum sp. 190524A02b]|uniref:N-acetylneuraminate synthase family protein n=1 Tax=Tenacibaculum vairaonense TaxID=3137860 RepID=UPI0031FB6D2C